jgi:hypothetical protein
MSLPTSNNAERAERRAAPSRPAVPLGDRPTYPTDEGSTFPLPEAMALADSAGTVREAALLLRERFAPLKVVVVDAFDMREETPAIAGSKRLIWGASSDGHCWQVSTDLAHVAGLYLADRG